MSAVLPSSSLYSRRHRRRRQKSKQYPSLTDRQRRHRITCQTTAAAGTANTMSTPCGWRRRSRPSLLVLLLPLLLLLSFTPEVSSSNGNTNNNDNDNNNNAQQRIDDYLDEQSVVLITGAAGFIGSELAMALHRTYQPKKIICVDSMKYQRRSSSSGTNGKEDTWNNNNNNYHNDEEELALFEYKRQRVFRTLQTIGPVAHFYRTDFRPVVPEYFDTGEVPVLHHIFQAHPDITHVVHLADPYLHTAEGQPQQAVPRDGDGGGQTRAGMMETLLEQLRLQGNQTGRVPHFTYASSYEVYNHIHNNNNNKPPFAEDDPITAPSSLAGAAKLMDEVIAATYAEMDPTLYSVGLRFFCVYGPWGLPGSPLFDMAEQAVASMGAAATNTAKTASKDQTKKSAGIDHHDVRDYVYIDDAVDAIMSAMQFRPPVSMGGDNGNKLLPPSIVINVGSGKGTTLREIDQQIRTHFPPFSNKTQEHRHRKSTNGEEKQPTISFASTERAKRLLGFEARVPLKIGLAHLCNWHKDRTLPYGGRPAAGTTTATFATTNGSSSKTSATVGSQGFVSCNRYDTECLRGQPVFPCSSECAHAAQCIPSYYDDVLERTRSLTADCPTVMYTVDLSESLNGITSAASQFFTASKSHFVNGKNCNLFFVSEQSLLVKRLKMEQPQNEILVHGFWTLLPMAVTSTSSMLEQLPKWSPGQFFGPTTSTAIYTHPAVIFRDIDVLVREASMQPFHENIQGKTALLIGKRRGKNPDDNTQTLSVQETIQEHAYRMIRIAINEELTEGYHLGDVADVDASSFLVHALHHNENVHSREQEEDSGRLFRCDVYGEMIQWQQVGGGVQSSIPKNSNDFGNRSSAVTFVLTLHDLWSRIIARKTGDDPWWVGDNVETVPAGKATSRTNARSYEGRRLQKESIEGDVDEDDGEEASEPWNQGGLGDTDAEQQNNGEVREENIFQQDAEDDEAEHSGDFGNGNADHGTETTEENSNYGGTPQGGTNQSQDTWMGILSSTPVRSFARIISFEAVGGVYLQDHEGANVASSQQ